MNLDAGRQPRSRAPHWLLWVMLALAWFATIQVRPLLDPDEGRYAEIPREMLASGDWVTPRFDGLKYFEKPPLQYWATAAVYAAFGLSEWSSRLWAFALAFACLPLTFGWVARLYGHGSALAALTALSVSPFFLVIAHLNLLDGAFTFWLSAAVFSFTLAQCAAPASASERRWMLAAWAAAALAVLSKGIVVGVLFGAALILYTADRARCAHLAPAAPRRRPGAVRGHRRAVVRGGVAAQSELPGIFLRARAFRALPHHRAPARRALVVFPAAAAARGAAVGAATRACLPRRLGRGGQRADRSRAADRSRRARRGRPAVQAAEVPG